MSRSVSVLLIARDRFSLTEECLENLLRRTSAPDRIVYVDAGSPRPVAQQLRALSRKHGVELVRVEEPGTANAARRIGLAALGQSKWTVILENDVLVEPGWLDSLLARAEMEEADVVVPLVNRVLPHRVHLPRLAGSDEPLSTLTQPRRRELPAVLCADPAWATCMLARGPAERVADYFDARAGALAAHWDLWLELKRAGVTVAIEPRAVVASCRRAALNAWDEAFFARQWHEKAIADSIDHFCRKWRLDQDDATLQALVQQSRALRDALLGHYRLSRYVGRRAAAWWHNMAIPLQRLVNLPAAEALESDALPPLPELAQLPELAELAESGQIQSPSYSK